jgi:hypothetical protein
VRQQGYCQAFKLRQIKDIANTNGLSTMKAGVTDEKERFTLVYLQLIRRCLVNIYGNHKKYEK